MTPSLARPHRAVPHPRFDAVPDLPRAELAVVEAGREVRGVAEVGAVAAFRVVREVAVEEPVELIVRGMTFSCGHPQCDALAELARHVEVA